jgi:hypothetical protein
MDGVFVLSLPDDGCHSLYRLYSISIRPLFCPQFTRRSLIPLAHHHVPVLALLERLHPIHVFAESVEQDVGANLISFSFLERDISGETISFLPCLLHGRYFYSSTMLGNAIIILRVVRCFDVIQSMLHPVCLEHAARSLLLWFVEGSLTCKVLCEHGRAPLCRRGCLISVQSVSKTSLACYNLSPRSCRIFPGR